MKFLLLLTQIEEAWDTSPPGEAERVYQQYMAIERELKAQGKFVDSVRLRSRREAKTLRNLLSGQRELVDGPCFDSREAIGGFYVLDCASMEEAVEWASRMPNYGHGAIEIRPFWE
jgi:hypothetical protein